MKPKGIPKETFTRDNIRSDLRKKLWKAIPMLVFAAVALAGLAYFVATNPIFMFRIIPGRLDLPGWVYVVLMPVMFGVVAWETWLVICGFRHKLYIVKDVLISSEEEKHVRYRSYLPYTYVTLRFSGYGEYIAMEKNYTWSKEYSMTSEGVYRTSFDGDEFYLVLSRPHNGKILLAYPAKYFTLEDE